MTERATVICAELVAWAREYQGPKFHAVMCDPPYGIEFMGKQWDNLDTRQPGDDTHHKSGVGPFDRAKVRHGVSAGYGGTSVPMQEMFREWGEALLPLLHPGALVFMFGGTRTWHRLAAGMEDAGFEMWDTLMWVHGQGFPKAQAIDALIDKANGDEREIIGRRPDHVISKKWRELEGRTDLPESILNVTTAASEQSAPWSGHKTAALKPAWEPILCFRAPSGGATYAELAVEHGSGSLNIEAGRIGVSKRVPGSISGTDSDRCYGDYGKETGNEDGHNPNLGRYPANLAFECTCEFVEYADAPVCGDIPNGREAKQVVAFGAYAGDNTKFTAHRGKMVVHTNPDCPAFILDAQAGNHPTARIEKPCPAPEIAVEGWGTIQSERSARGYDGEGGPSRFFYCAKASRSEREEGLDAFEEVSFGSSNAAKAAIARGETDYGDSSSEFGANVIKRVRNDHPTVKPIDLAHWLAKLLVPPPSVNPRRLLVPFSGSGSEIIGALLAGWDEVVGVEQDQHYAEIAQARIAHWAEIGVTLERREAEEIVSTVRQPVQGGLF